MNYTARLLSTKKLKIKNSASPSKAKAASYTKSKMVQAFHMQLHKSLGVQFLKWSRGLISLFRAA